MLAYSGGLAVSNDQDKARIRAALPCPCDDCFAFYYPRHTRVHENGEVEVHTIGYLCPTRSGRPAIFGGRAGEGLSWPKGES